MPGPFKDKAGDWMPEKDILYRIDCFCVGPGCSASLERHHSGWRIRARERHPETSLVTRRAFALPDNPELIAKVRKLIQYARDDRRLRKEMEKALRESCRELDASAKTALAELRARVVGACGAGRVVKRRVAAAFNNAAAMGMDMLADFIGRQPWNAVGKPAGRPGRANPLTGRS